MVEEEVMGKRGGGGVGWGEDEAVLKWSRLLGGEGKDITMWRGCGRVVLGMRWERDCPVDM